ncbi:MAG: GNAT family N-acetyltransferase [Anaerolineae bacterium]|nr:MAG: GNAT family N-acetyltransferase [Anaerolineae bacterium]
MGLEPSPAGAAGRVTAVADGQGVRSAFLLGQRVYLRPSEEDDLVCVRKWANDSEVRRLTGEVTPMSQADAEEFLERVRSDENRLWFVVVLKEGDRAIGEAGLLRMFHPWRTTDLSLIIGEKDAWGRGYGSEAIQLLLDYAFGYLGFHRVAVGVAGFNERAIRFYEKVGFRREGVQRDGYYYDYEYHDFIMMSILEHEFREKQP